MTDKVGEFDSFAPGITASFPTRQIEIVSVFCRQLGYFTNRSSQELDPIYLGNLWAARARALAISSVRLRGGAFVSSELRKLQETAAILSTAARNAASLAFDGLLKPLTFLTNCKEAARISSSVTGGSKLKRVLMFLHTIVTSMFQSGNTKTILEFRQRFVWLFAI